MQDWLMRKGFESELFSGGGCAHDPTKMTEQADSGFDQHAPLHGEFLHNPHVNSNLSVFHQSISCDDVNFLIDEQCGCSVYHENGHVAHSEQHRELQVQAVFGTCKAVKHAYSSSGCCSDTSSPVSYETLCDCGRIEPECAHNSTGPVDLMLLSNACSSHMTNVVVELLKTTARLRETTNTLDSDTCDDDILFARHFCLVRQLAVQIGYVYFRHVHRSIDTTISWFAHHAIAQGTSQIAQLQKWLYTNGHVITKPTKRNLNCSKIGHYSQITHHALDRLEERVLATSGDLNTDFLEFLQPVLIGTIALCNMLLEESSSIIQHIDLCNYVVFDQNRKLSWSTSRLSD